MYNFSNRINKKKTNNYQRVRYNNNNKTIIIQNLKKTKSKLIKKDYKLQL
jgi:hypothetical protein